MRINHNIAALNTHRQLNSASTAQSKSMEKLSSGLRINRAGDDAAGLAISEKMRAQIRGLDQASRNAQDGISMIQTAEGALGETHSILQRMRELATQSANDTNVAVDREEIQKEMNQLTSEINRIGNTTEFNTQKLLNGGKGSAVNGKLTVTTTPYEATGKIGNDTLDIDGGPATGKVSNLATTVNSVKGGTVAIDPVKTQTSSKLESKAGTIGSPLTEVTASIKGGTISINKAEIKTGTAAGTAFAGNVTTTKATNAAATAFTGNVTTTKATNAAATAGVTGDATVSQTTTGSDGFTAKFSYDFDTAFTGLTAGEESSISIGGKEYTFTAGASAADSAAALAAVLKLDAATGMTGIAAAGIAASGTKIEFTASAADTQITIGTFTTASGTVASDIAGAIKTGGSVNTKSLTIDFATAFTGYSDGDEASVSIGGREISFKIGADDKASAGNLANAIKADIGATTTPVGTYNNIAGTGVTASGTDGKITFTSAADTDEMKIGSYTTNSADAVTTVKGAILTGGSVNTKELTIDFTSAFKDRKAGETTSVSIGGREYEFSIGATDADSRNNLVTAIKADFTANGGQYSNIAIGDIAAGTGTGEIKFTSTAGTAEMKIGSYTTNSADTTAAIQGQAKIGGEAAVYTYEFKTQFTAGDQIIIGDQTFTAITGTPANNNEFTIGTTIENTIDNLVTKLNTNASMAGSGQYTIAKGSPNWSGDKNSIVITKNTTGTDTNKTAYNANVVAKPTLDIKGEYKFEIASNFGVGQKVTIAGQEFEARASGSNDATGFKIGADIDETAANLLAAINSNTTLTGSTGKFDAAILKTGNATAGITGTGFNTDADTIVLKEKTASGDTMTNVVGANVDVKDQDPIKGVYTFDVTKNFSAGDSVNVGGTKYTAVESGKGSGVNGALGTNEFVVGADIEKSVDNLVTAITAGTKYTATKENSEFFTGNRVKLTEKTPSGTDLSSVTGGKAADVKGKVEFIITDNLASGDVLRFDGKLLLAGGQKASAGLNGDFAVGKDATETAENIADAITNATTSSSKVLQELQAKFTVSASGGKLTFTENEASGTNITDLKIGTNKDGRADGEVKQSYEIKTQALDAGSKVKIGDAEITLAKKGTASMVAEEIVNQITNATTTSPQALQDLKKNYDVTADGDKLVLTKKAAGNDTKAIEASFETTEYNGYSGKLQIGANTGQSISISVNDMRAAALKISGDAIEGGAEVTARDGAKATYVSIANVTNGSDDSETEFALDVSTHEKATAAISVINDAIETVSAERSKLGAYQNRLEHTINNLSTSSENLTAAESRVRDVDMAKEMMEQTKNSILAQAAQAMLAQANQQPQGVLQLLR